MEDYGIQFDLPKSVVCDYVHEVLEVLLLNKNFTLFGKNHTKFDSSEDRLLNFLLVSFANFSSLY